MNERTWKKQVADSFKTQENYNTLFSDLICVIAQEVGIENLDAKAAALRQEREQERRDKAERLIAVLKESP